MKVFEYETLDRPDRWCREGLAVEVEEGRILDTFWSLGSESHRLTFAELATIKLVFDTDDYEHISRYPRDAAERTWLEYAPEDRAIITSQHRLQNDYYIRKGSKPDFATKIQNAEAELAECVRKAERAARDVEWAQRQLDELRAAADHREVDNQTMKTHERKTNG